MAALSLYPFHSLNTLSQSYFTLESVLILDKKKRLIQKVGKGSSRLGVVSTHSNHKLVKSNRRSRYGQTFSPYDSDDEDVEKDEDDDDDWFSDDEFEEVAEIDAKRKSIKSQKGTSSTQGSKRQPEINSVTSRQSLLFDEDRWAVKKSKNPLTNNLGKEVGSYGMNDRGKLSGRKLKETKFPRLSEEINLDARWIPLLDYLSTFGLKESNFIQMYERHMPSLQINVVSAQERLDYLLSVGVKHKDVRRMILRQPQILQYTVNKNLKSHVAFLISLGIPNSRIGQIIAAAPSLFSYSLEKSLKPTVRFLVEEVGIKENDLGKVVQLSPQILVQRIDKSWNARYIFLSKELGAPKDSIAKMVKKHPQFLHYSIEDGLLPRINFLRSIGMRNSEILKILTSLTQVLSLSLEQNLKPKYMYLINELQNDVHSLAKYPTYLSLSLDQRIRPRHKFLVAIKKAPKGPFPLSSFVPTDESFCQQWAGTSLDKYLAFRQRLLLKEFAKKYERKG